MTEATLYPAGLWLLFILAGLTFVVLRWVPAPYGRHARRGWGPTMPGRTAWMLMESPAVVAFALIFGASGGGSPRASVVPVLLFALWQLHYVHRTLVFPLRMRSPRPIPVLVVVLGLSFNGLNAYLNARWIGALGDYPMDWLFDPRFVGGVMLFWIGFAINLHSDEVLRRLRAPGEVGYRIPDEGLHRYVSAPNYFGEIVEWTGWALACGSLAGLGFASYTVANLLPRALDHHRWYRTTFPEYPSERRALVPFVL